MTVLEDSLRSLSEAREREFFEPYPGAGTPSSSHEVKVVRFAPGSDKSRWFSKTSSDELQTVSEYLSWRIYKVFGMRVAKSAVLVIGDRDELRFVAKGVPGKQVPGDRDPSPKLRATDFSEGLFVDALLGNWDVVGNMPRFNVFVDDNGRAYRIDTGGLDYRAQGKRKGGAFGDEVGELQTFAGIGGKKMPGHASDVFGSMSVKRMAKAAKKYRRVSWGKIRRAMKAATEEVVEVLEDRPRLARRAVKYISEMTRILKRRHEYIMEKLDDMGL